MIVKGRHEVFERRADQRRVHRRSGRSPSSWCARRSSDGNEMRVFTVLSAPVVAELKQAFRRA